MRELNFEVGDWVTSNHSKIPIKSDEYTISQHNTNPGFYDFKKWEPEEGDWVIQKPKHLNMEGYTNFNTVKYKSHMKNIISDLEPFIGQLPIFIKEIK